MCQNATPSHTQKLVRRNDKGKVRTKSKELAELISYLLPRTIVTLIVPSQLKNERTSDTFIVPSEVRGMTLAKLIVASEVRGTTLAKLSVASEVRDTTLANVIVVSEVRST